MTMKNIKINVKGVEIVTFNKNNNDYISLTDIARYKNSEAGLVISHWLSTRFTVEFMGIWEQMHNPDFKVTEFSYFKNHSGANGFALSVQQWVNKTNAIGIFATRGRYNSGTYAHKDIAFEFASWISAEFKLFLIKEFQRLKEEESKRLELGWNVKRTLAKINYKIHTDAIKEHLLPPHISKQSATILYANEADVLNMALFGKTAREWRDKNSGRDGNIRDYADVTQLVVLANLEGMNAELIRRKLPQNERLAQLNQIAIAQMRSLIGNTLIKRLE